LAIGLENQAVSLDPCCGLLDDPGSGLAEIPALWVSNCTTTAAGRFALYPEM